MARVKGCNSKNCDMVVGLTESDTGLTRDRVSWENSRGEGE